MTGGDIINEAIMNMFRETVTEPLEEALCTAVSLLAIEEAFHYQTIRPEYYGDLKTFHIILCHASNRLTERLQRQQRALDGYMVESYQMIFNDALQVSSRLQKEVKHEREV